MSPREHGAPIRSAGELARRGAVRAPRRGGVAMIEVLFALSLFAASTAVISSSFSACATSVSRMQLQAVADNLAISMLSELQLELLPAEDDGPYAFEEPFEDWTYEVVTAEMTDVIDIDGPVMTSVEIIIRHYQGECTRRVTTLVPAPPEEEEAEEGPEGEAEMGQLP